MKKEELIQKFQELYGAEGDIRTYFAPGRVNLIGEHTDYNGGHVFPCALTIGTYAVARKRTDRKLRFFSVNFERLGIIESSLDDLVPSRSAGWTNYPKGVMWTFGKRGMEITNGVDILLYGNIPNGSGLSSSASVEVVTGVMLRDLFGFDSLTNIDLALIGQQSENEYNGVNCGIMDQFAVAMGKKDHAVYLNTGDLSYEYVPVELKGVKLVLANSNKKHALNESAYNDRRRECEEALRNLQEIMGIEALCQLDPDTFETCQKAIRDEDCRRRARHAVMENARTKKAVEVLKQGDIEAFGRLLNESHQSLSQDYEVTGEEMDALAEAAWEQPGVYGSRMTGGGFGGCTVSLVREEDVPSFIENTGKRYTEKTSLKADFYVVEIGGGPVVL